MSREPVRNALVPLALLLLGGCTAHGRIRTEASAVATSAESLSTPEGRREAARHSVEVHPDFTTVFVEFDDQGRFWDRAQVDLLERTLEEEAHHPGYEGVLISVFAHGWKHDCSVCDPNVACFRTLLGRIVRDADAVSRLSDGAVAPRRVVGIYVGWRGRSATTRALGELTFFARERVALRIGSGDLVELLTRADLFVRRQNAGGQNRARMVTIGHSLGGTMVYTALANILKMRVLESLSRTGPAGPPVIEGFGDLVVLINPAFEASLYRSLHELTRSFERFSPLQTPVLITIASETDSANGTWFPLGRGLETLWERTADDAERRSLRTAVGNYQEFFGYRLTAATAKRPDPAGSGSRSTAPSGGGCLCALDLAAPGTDQLKMAADLIAAAPGSADRTPASCDALPSYGRAALSCIGDVDPANPFWVVRASDDVVHGHSGFFTDESIDFIRFVVARALGKRAIRTALAREPRWDGTSPVEAGR